ncbi:BREX-2 system adenine-specific DNA-methyltransferase PglX [Streptomyces sp. NPDC101225]|uniref:BREX-2 system adenine-specific DNA-methyltransferase PglX n=1 Tax=Streptomyces sp. NPDC101225 TaxID=3366135 RepID=UPI00380421AB
MIDRKALLNDLKQQVKAVETDLGRQVKALADVGARLKAEYDQARKLGRTAATWTSWLDERVTQVAVAWVLGTVFVRFCEDNRLIPEPYLTGPDGDRRELAESRYDAYVESDEDPTYRGWLRRAFAEVGDGQAGRMLFDSNHNPLYQIPLSHDGARELVDFWRRRDEAGFLVHDFTDPLNEDGTEGWDTRFLGDLYQDLSETARETYALLQTPEFVEEFILDRTMNPAVREFGYEDLKMIDPTCGSGHFVLGAFRRLVRMWAEGQPGTDVHERVSAALKSVHGVDVNPFAVAIARFRLLIAGMATSGVRTLNQAAKYEWPIHLAVGDSLIKSRRSQQGNLFGEADEDLVDELAEFKYATEDVQEYPDILRPGRYHLVVGNPPYITVKDKKLNELYRELYSACAGTYALSVPFAQRFFELAKRGDAEGRHYGMVGQITANSFLKREFGTKLIEGFFGHAVELTEVVDTSGAYIPGHSTPTIILVGRRRGGDARLPVIRTVRSVQGEPATPVKAEQGLVWQAIVEQIDKPGSVSQWVSVDDLDRKKYFGRQPWILTDGGLEMVEQLNQASQGKLAEVIDEIGTGAVTREDSAYMLGQGHLRRARIEKEHQRFIVEGTEIRDYVAHHATMSLWPYSPDSLEANASSAVQQVLWPHRRLLRDRVAFGKTQVARGLTWFEYSMFFRGRYNAPFKIPFAFVATHNHFVLDRGGKVFKQSAPVIKLREGASDEEYLRLIGLLNSSTACFWLKQVSHSKGNATASSGMPDQPWSWNYEFTGTKLEEFPLPAEYPIALAVELDSLAQQLAHVNPAAIALKATPTAPSLREGKIRWESTRGRMIAFQEELDWQVYSIYGLHPAHLSCVRDEVPELEPGQRAFEIVLARKIESGEVATKWFSHHGYTAITEVPEHWPTSYREIVQKRIDAIESNRAISMVERPEYKRRWATEGWDVLQDKALRSWLLDRMEKRDHWFDENGQPTVLTLARLADALSRDEDFVSVAKLYAPRKELAKVVAELITDEHVPFLSALRYKPSGLKKRADWEEVWDLQRKEDAAPDEPAKRKIRDSIPVPPKYTSADFLRPSYWKARGKLDVPKERFISYGQTNAATPELYGWAGWDHREQAQALATYFTNTALSTEEITPFLAGLLELQPWLYQWHNEFDMLYSGSPADFFAAYRQQQQGEHGLTDDDLRNWRPQAATRGRRAVVKK